MKKLLFLGAAIALLSGQLIYAQTHHWPLKADLNDVVGDLNGTNNGVTFQDDAVRGPVAYFEGTSAYANLPSFVNGLTEMTIACWWRMDESRVWARIYSFGHGDQTEPKDVLMVIPVSGAADNPYRFTLSNPDGAWYDIDIPKSIIDVQLDTWYYSVVVLKPDSIIFYHDDQLVFAESGFTRAFGTITDTENAIGKSFWPDPLWKGALSDLRVYDTGLSQSEVVALYNETVATGINDSKARPDDAVIYSYLDKIDVRMNKPVTDEVVSVYSITGALLAEKPLSEINQISFRSGVYIVRVEGSSTSQASKVFVK